MAWHRELNDLVIVFPLIVMAIIAYFNHAMSDVGAKLEPEQLLRQPAIIIWTVVTAALAFWLLYNEENFIESLQVL